jgi:hypothetical protein
MSPTPRRQSPLYAHGWGYLSQRAELSIRPRLCLLFDGASARLGNLTVLLAATPRDTDGPDNFAFHDDRNAAINRNCACEAQQAETLSASSHAVLKQFGGAPEERCRSCFLDR